MGFTSSEIRNNKKIVLLALKNNGNLLKYVPDSLKHDKELVLTAVNQNYLAIQYINNELVEDKAILKSFNKHLNLLSHKSKIEERKMSNINNTQLSNSNDNDLFIAQFKLVPLTKNKISF